MGNRQCKKRNLKQAREIVPKSVSSKEAHCKYLAELKADHKLTTWLDKEEISFIWEIKNFDQFRVTEDIKSQTFRFKNGDEWMVMIEKQRSDHGFRCLRVKREQSQEQKMFNEWSEYVFKVDYRGLPRSTDGIPPIFPLYKIQVLGSEGVLAEFKNEKDMSYFHFLHSIHESEFKTYLTDGDLKLFCRLFHPGVIRQVKCVNSFVGFEKLLTTMKHLLTTGTDADVEIVTGTKSFPAHKIILKSHSPVFRKIFETEMLEAATNILTIEDFGEEAVGAMLSYIYTGTADNFSQNALELLQISDKYSIDGLKEDTQLALIQILSPENAAEYLQVADVFNASRLKDVAVQFL